MLERGAIKIYEGQLLALNTIVKNDELKKKLKKCKSTKKNTAIILKKKSKEENIRPTKFLPLWDILGVGLGFGSTLIGKKQQCFVLLRLKK